MIGAEGNPGPGPSLTTIGRRLSAAQLDRALDDPRAPMPSFKFLAPHEFHAIVTYLASLKSRRDVIAVGGSPSFGPGPLRMSPELCGHQKVFYATILGRANAKKMTRQARAIVEQVDRQLARSLQQACRHSLSPHGAG